MHKLHLMVAVVGALASLPAWCQDAVEIEENHALSLDLPTPHTDWAQPYAGGKTRVLFITNARGTEPREAVELMQRFDLDLQTVYWARIVDTTNEQWHGGELGEKRVLRLLERKWDCFVFFHVPLTNMSAQQQYLLLKAVTEGAGLVFVGVDDKRVLKPINQLKQIPTFLTPGPVGDAFLVGKGRALRLPHRPQIDYYEGWETDYDCWQERLGRAVLWAAHKDPAADLGLELSEPKLDRGAQAKVTVRLSGRLVGQKPLLHLSLRRGPDAPYQFPVRETTPGTPVEVTIPTLPAGAYHVDARLISQAGVEAWGTVPFEVTSGRSVKEVALQRTWGEVGDHLQGTVSLQGSPLEGEVLRVRLLDPARRELMRKDLLPSREKAEFDFVLQDWMPMLVTVEAQLRDRTGEVAGAYRYFSVTRRNRGHFNFLMWDFPTDTMAPYVLRSLADTGVTLMLNGNPAPPITLAANDISYVPYTTRVMSKLNADGTMQPFCWNDPKAVKDHVTKLAEKYLPSRQQGVFVYSLGDEVDTRGCCLSPYCAAAYRAYLQESYGTLEALNRSWGTAFANWTEVGLSKAGDNEEANSLNAKNYPRWFDRQAFKSYNMVMFCQKYAQAYSDIDPQARTGFEGAGRFEAGDDLDLIVRKNAFWSPYPGTADEVIRSIAPPGYPHSNWMGYTKDADSLLSKYWRMVTRGMDSVWWWRWDGIGRFRGWLSPDLSPWPAVDDILRDTQMVRDGLGDVLLQSSMLDDGVAMLYSYPSTFAHKLGDGGTFGGYEAVHSATHRALRDKGLQFRYVTDRMLRLGEFDGRRYQVLLLTRAEAIGDREAEVIRQFVADGGTVIADVRPGIYDDHCKLRAAGVLDDLFGIKRTASTPATRADIELPGTKLAGVPVDSSVSLTDGAAAAMVGETPVLISKQTGKGRALLLNFVPATAATSGKSASGVADVQANFLGRLLEQAGVKPLISLADATGKPVRGVEVVRWRDRGIQIVALFREAAGGSPETVTVGLPGARYVYDLRNHKAFGRTQTFTTSVLPCRASFFALCGTQIQTPEVRLPSSAVEPGTLVKAGVTVPGAEGFHAVRIRVKAAGGDARWASQTVLADRGNATVQIPIAYNDPAGVYEVSAVDLFSNQATVTRFTVQEPADAGRP